MDGDERLSGAQIAGTAGCGGSAVDGTPDWCGMGKPLRAAPKLKPPALLGDIYLKQQFNPSKEEEGYSSDQGRDT